MIYCRLWLHSFLSVFPSTNFLFHFPSQKRNEVFVWLDLTHQLFISPFTDRQKSSFKFSTPLCFWSTYSFFHFQRRWRVKWNADDEKQSKEKFHSRQSGCLNITSFFSCYCYPVLETLSVRLKTDQEHESWCLSLILSEGSREKSHRLAQMSAIWSIHYIKTGKNTYEDGWTDTQFFPSLVNEHQECIKIRCCMTVTKKANEASKTRQANVKRMRQT